MEIDNNAVKPENSENSKETETKKINCKLLANNGGEDSATIEELSIICSFAILLQWSMKLVDHHH